MIASKLWGIKRYTLYGPLFSRSVMESLELGEILDIPQQEMAFFEAFNKHDVRYLLIGGTAVRFHGHLRTADDVDVLVDHSRENARRLYDALTQVIGRLVFTVNDLCEPKQKLRPQYYCLDILTSLTGIDFGEAYRQKVTVTISGTPIHIMSKPDLILAKKVTARQKDIEDVDALERGDAV